eukprot:TRINITY_DN26457_c0_g1_i10.p1 TRINITY_DN26457_c0_g1~~TRINITY_DN26457_c0_g1_i10.p1  ORF type:complete len:618 (-),score=166.41 TRINITY_DN26457_c0_g1_i10:1370-3223(-)
MSTDDQQKQPQSKKLKMDSENQAREELRLSQMARLMKIKNAQPQNLEQRLIQQILLDYNQVQTDVENLRLSIKTRRENGEGTSSSSSQDVAKGKDTLESADSACDKMDTDDSEDKEDKNQEDKDKEALARADSACARMDKVNGYLSLAFTENLTLVLHKAQFGSNPFYFDNLPDVVFDKILEKLSFQDKKNLREVSSNIADRIVLLDHSFRRWRINLDDKSQKFIPRIFQRAIDKEITELAFFQVLFFVDTSYLKKAPAHTAKFLQIMNLVKPYVTFLNLTVYDDVDNIETLYLPKLEILQIEVHGFTGPGYYPSEKSMQAAKSIATNHAKTLNVFELRSLYGIFPAEPQMISGSKLEMMSVLARGVEPFLNFGRNITKLMFKCSDVKGVDFKDLVFPNLKYLDIDSSKGMALVKPNMNTLETLIIQNATYHGSNEIFDLPTMLPKLKTFLAWNCNRYFLNETVPSILLMTSGTLKHLLISDVGTEGTNPVVKMNNLTHFVFDSVRDWSSQMIKENRMSLQSLVFHYRDVESREKTLPSLLATVKNLKEIIIIANIRRLFGAETTIADIRAKSCVQAIQRKCPKAKIVIEAYRMQFTLRWYLPKLDPELKDANIYSA